MGAFSHRIKNMFNKKQSGFTEEQEKLIKQHGGKKNLRRLDQLPIMYAIRLTDHPDMFLHPVGETKDQLMYAPKRGIVGAAFWKWEQAMAFIKDGPETNLEMVRVDQTFLDEQNAK